jgi:hypothetical protein
MRLVNMYSIVLTVAAALAAGVAMAQGRSTEVARAKAAYHNIGGAATVERAPGYAPIRAAVQQDARPAGRPTARPVSDLRGSDPAPVGEGLNSDGRGAHANIEDLRRRLDANEAELRTLRGQQQWRTDVYTGGLTEEQMRALD